jgi:hypothetical protein
MLPHEPSGARVSATSTRAWFISKIRIFDRTALHDQRTIARMRIALHLFALPGRSVVCRPTHRKWQPTMIDDLNQKKSQRIAHFKAARSEHLASLRFQKVVHAGSDDGALHSYIVATSSYVFKIAGRSGRTPWGGRVPDRRTEVAEAVAGKSCTGAAGDRLTSPAGVRRFLRLARRPPAQVAELVDALVSGTSGAIRGGSSPLLGTISQAVNRAALG